MDLSKALFYYLVSDRTRWCFSSMYGFLKDIVLVSCKLKNKVVPFSSSMYFDDTVDMNLVQFPDIVDFYNHTKCVDLVDQMKGTYYKKATYVAP